MHIFKYFLKHINTQFNKIVKVVRTDNGTEFLNSFSNISFKKNKVIHRTTSVYSKKNGVAEKKHRHILELTKAIRFKAAISIKFWENCVLSAIYLKKNRFPSLVFGYVTPY